MTNEELAVRYQQGEKDALNVLWEQTQKLIYKQCHKFYNQNVERCTAHGVVLDDLLQEGFFALIDAAKAYKIDGEYKFTAYLSYPIKNHFNAMTGGTIKKEPLNNSRSLNVQATEDADTETGDLIPDPSGEIPFSEIEDLAFHNSLHKVLNDAVKSLEPEQERAIKSRFYEDKTFKQIAEIEHTNADKVRMLEQKGLSILRYGENRNKLRPFIVDLDSFAYYGTSFTAWKNNGSVQERIAEKR